MSQFKGHLLTVYSQRLLTQCSLPHGMVGAEQFEPAGLSSLILHFKHLLQLGQCRRDDR